MSGLTEPRGRFQEMVRRLADSAISAIHHDVSEPEYSNEVRALERRFTNILRGYLSARSREARRALPPTPTTGDHHDR